MVIVSFFALLILWAVFTRTLERKFIALLLIVAFNPIVNRIGIFENSTAGLLGNTFLNLVFPFLVLPSVTKMALGRAGKIFIFFIAYSFSVLYVSQSYGYSTLLGGIKTLSLMLGTWFWVCLFTQILRLQYGYILNPRIFYIFILICLILLGVSLALPSYYFAYGRLQGSGGFDSPAILGGLTMLLATFSLENRIWRRLVGLLVGLTILLMSGSRAGVIAVFCALIFFVIMPNKDGEINPQIRRVIFSNKLVAIVQSFICLLLILYSYSFTNFRSFDFLSLLQGSEGADLGTFNFRRNMLTNMREIYAEGSLLNQIIGFGPGSGTQFAMRWIDSLNDVNYTSGRVFHNGFLQLLIEQGLLGILLCTIFTIVLNKQLRREGIRISGAWIVFILLASFLSSNPFAVAGTLALLAYLPLTVRMFPFNKVAHERI